MQRSLLAAAALLLSCTPLLAQAPAGAGAAADRPWELTVTAGWRGGAQFEETGTAREVDADPALSYGLAFGRWMSPSTRWEITWTGQSSSFEDRAGDLRVDHLHWTGVYEPRRTGKPDVYVLLSAGLTRWSADLEGASDATDLSGSAGVGTRIRLSDRTSLRLEGRAWAIVTDSDVAGLCSGGCTLRFSGSGAFQLEGSVGLSTRF